MKILKKIGVLLHSTRRAQRYSLDELSARSGLHPNTIHLIEKGKTDPKLTTLIFLARALNVSTADWLEELEHALYAAY